MKKLIFVIILAIAFLTAAYAFDWRIGGRNSQVENGLIEQKPSATPKKEEDPIRKKIEAMSLEEKIGQMVMVGFEGYEVNEEVSKLLEEQRVGGFILFKRNIKNGDQLLELINSLKKSNSKNKNPLFISVDEEGGSVTRMPEELMKIPTNKKIGEINDRDFSFGIGGLIADEVKAFGFNMNFAPVLDINSNPKNPVIGDRSFGAEEKKVSSLGIETMKGIQAKGVISVVKHFPGHGDTSVDSHVGLPVINYNMDRLKGFELVPFAEAVSSGADAVMVAHILLPQIDSVNPSSFSKVLITDVLRKELDFDGVVITDDMTMGAITENYDIGNAAVKSVIAGSDIILVCHGYKNEIAVINSLKSALDMGSISEKRIEESVYRILKLKQKYKIEDKTVDSVDIADINGKIRELLDKYQKTSQ